MKTTPPLAIRSMLFAGARQLWPAGVGISFVRLCMTFAHAEPESEADEVTRSPRGTFHIVEQRQEGKDRMKGIWVTSAWIVPTADPTRRVQLGEAYDDSQGRTFFISPDEQWICAIVHVHSQMQGLMLYRRKTGLQFELVMADDTEGIADGPKWKFGAHDGPGHPPSFDFDRVSHNFVAWSADSGRLLVNELLYGSGAWSFDYYYCNLHDGSLEHTDYVRTLNRTFRKTEALSKYVVPAFAEPLDPLPPEKQLHASYEAAEHRLNEIYKAVMEREKPEEKQSRQNYQRLWLKARDSAAEAFAGMGSKAERPSRRLQYLADATANRAQEMKDWLEEHLRYELNGAYAALQETLGPEGGEALKKEQIKWLKKRDQITNDSERARFTEARASELKAHAEATPKP